MALETDSSIPADSKQGAGGLGTFPGVFTPSILTIPGIILFLRLGYETGSDGLGRVLIIIAVANLIFILTSQSPAAIATNLRVKVGPILAWLGADWATRFQYGANLKTCFRMGYNLVLLHYDPMRWETLQQTDPRRRRIDAWRRADATRHRCSFSPI